MTRQKENKFVDKVHDRLDERVFRLRTGEGLRANGVLDWYYSGPYKDSPMWVEYKWVDAAPPAEGHVKHNLSALQKRFLNKQVEHHVNALLIIGSPMLCAIVEGPIHLDTVPHERFQFTLGDVAGVITAMLTP